MLKREEYVKSFLIFAIFIIPFNISAQTSMPPGLPSGPECNTSGMSPFISISGVGWEGQGAGISIADINRNGLSDIVLMAYDNPSGQNTFRYRIGWDVNFVTGLATSWSPNYITVNGVGWEGDGADIEIADIDNNGINDMILMAYDNPAGRNNFRYKIGWNLNTSGQTTNWSPTIMIDGVGNSGDGAGICIYDINKNNIPDILLMAYDSTAGRNNFRYRIGWDINTSGVSTNWTSAPLYAPGVGSVAEGAGVDIADIDLDGNVDIIMMAYDDASWNNFRYRIGWNLQSNGLPEDWSRYFVLKGVGTVGQGAGICHHVYMHNYNPTPILIFMAYDAPARMNNFRYFALPVTTSGTCFGYADDSPPSANNILSIPTSNSSLTGTRLFNLNMSEVQQTAQDALGLYIFGCMLAHIFGEDPPTCWIDHPDSDVKCDMVFANSNFSEKIGPDVLAAAVAYYVDANMGWVVDNANSFVLNTFHGLSYFAGAEGTPAYYTIRYTNPARYPTLINRLNAQNPNWAIAYNDGKLYHGDCEDFAILRHALLRALGFDRNFIWNAREPGHEYNIVLYKGAYRIMDYGPIYTYLCSSGHDGLNAVWNQSHGPRFSEYTATWLRENVLFRLYPDRCGAGYGWLLSRRIRTDIVDTRHCR